MHMHGSALRCVRSHSRSMCNMANLIAISDITKILASIQSSYEKLASESVARSFCLHTVFHTLCAVYMSADIFV